MFTTGCGATPRPTVVEEPKAAANSFIIQGIDELRAPPGEQAPFDIMLIKGEGFSSPVTYTLESGDGFVVSPTKYEAAEDESGYMGVIAGKKVGKYTLKVTAKSAAGETQTCEIPVFVE